MHFLARKQCSIKYETNEIQYAIFCVKNLHKIHNVVSLHLVAVSKLPKDFQMESEGKMYVSTIVNTDNTL